MPAPTPASLGPAAAGSARATAAAAPTPIIPTVRCQPIGAGCDNISTSAGGATGVKGLNAVDSASLHHQHLRRHRAARPGPVRGQRIRRRDQQHRRDPGLQHRASAPIRTDPARHRDGAHRRGGAAAATRPASIDPSNGGHWFFTEIVSASPEAAGGPFTGCFAGVANPCYEGIAVSQGSNPFGPYWVYFLERRLQPGRAGLPLPAQRLREDRRDPGRLHVVLRRVPAPPRAPGIGGGIFNGAQQFAFDKNALERAARHAVQRGPNPTSTWRIENMGLLPTPDGNCDGTNGGLAGITCWVAVIPAQPADAGQFDNPYGGSGFMVGGLDFYSFVRCPPGATTGWRRGPGPGSATSTAVAAVPATASISAASCSPARPVLQPRKRGRSWDTRSQKAGRFRWVTNAVPPASARTRHGVLSRNGLNTNGDFMTQASQAQGQVWAAMSTQVNQTFGTLARGRSRPGRRLCRTRRPRALRTPTACSPPRSARASSCRFRAGRRRSRRTRGPPRSPRRSAAPSPTSCG